MVEVLEDIELWKSCLFIRSRSILVVSDLQLGYEESMHAKGVQLPRFQMKEIQRSLDDMISRFNPKMIVIDGDIKHEFGGISRSEWYDVSALISSLKAKAELVLLRGNHDNMLEPILNKVGCELMDHLAVGKYYICHGHIIPEDGEFKKASVVIIGHEHPALALRENGRVESFKCFVVGRYGKKSLVVLPSLNPLTEGTDILKERLLSPFLKEGIGEFQAYVIAEEILNFGKIKDLVHL